MAELQFNAQLFKSQALPEPLPEPGPYAHLDLSGLTEEQKTYLGLNSGFAGIGLIDTPKKVLQHCELMTQERERMAALNASNVPKKTPQQKAQEQEARKSRAATIEAANQVWRKAVQQRKEADLAWAKHLAELNTQRKVDLERWDAFVALKRMEFQTLRDA